MTGPPVPPNPDLVADARTVTIGLLSRRTWGATVCPSEVARALLPKEIQMDADWRDAMPAVHAAIDRLLAEGKVILSWKGRRLTTRAGPYRIAHRSEGGA